VASSRGTSNAVPAVAHSLDGEARVAIAPSVVARTGSLQPAVPGLRAMA